MKQILKLYMLLFAGALLFAACSDDDDPVTDPEPIEVTGVKLDKDAITLAVDDTVTLIATVLPEDAAVQNVTWTSENKAVATVDANGKVTALEVGQTTITVTTEDGGKTATCKVDVELRTEMINGIECILVKAGTFQMGSQEYTGSDPRNEWLENNELEQHSVTLSKDFYLGRYEVTNTQFCKFLNEKNVGADGKLMTETNGEQSLIYTYMTDVKYDGEKWVPVEGKDNYPALSLSWYGADEFCRWAGGSLPTEAQWEYACRAGTTTRYSWGDEAWKATEYGWCNTNSSASTHEVGQMKANPWGFYDMHGNVWEWCQDGWDGRTGYGSEAVTDPVNTGAYGVMRGGAYDTREPGIRSAYRLLGTLGTGKPNAGVRVAFAAPEGK